MRQRTLPSPTPVRRTNLTQLILDQLRDYVLTHGLKEEDRLPPERELAARLSVSRPSLRNALDWLESRGALRRVQGGGTFLQASFLSAIVEQPPAQVNDAQRLIEVVEARLFLEPLLIGLAAERARREDVDELATHVAETRARLDDAEAFRWCDLQFHLKLARLAGNAVLSTAVESILNEVFLLWTNRPEHFDNAQMQVQHEQLVEALVKRDAETAVTRMREHLQPCGQAVGIPVLRAIA
ncbi:MAG: FadR/GntR family transcriptional regulator [Pirellulales bacterium]